MKHIKWLILCAAANILLLNAYNVTAKEQGNWVQINAPRTENPHLTKVENAFAFFVNTSVTPSEEDGAGWLKTEILMQIPNENIENVDGEQLIISGTSYAVSDISIIIPIFIECKKELKREGPMMTYSERYGVGTLLESSQVGTEFPVAFYKNDPIENNLIKLICPDTQ